MTPMTDHDTLVQVREALERGDVEYAKRLIDANLDFKKRANELHQASKRKRAKP